MKEVGQDVGDRKVLNNKNRFISLLVCTQGIVEMPIDGCNR